MRRKYEFHYTVVKICEIRIFILNDELKNFNYGKLEKMSISKEVKQEGGDEFMDKVVATSGAQDLEEGDKPNVLEGEEDIKPGIEVITE